MSFELFKKAAKEKEERVGASVLAVVCQDGSLLILCDEEMITVWLI